MNAIVVLTFQKLKHARRLLTMLEKKLQFSPKYFEWLFLMNTSDASLTELGELHMTVIGLWFSSTADVVGRNGEGVILFSIPITVKL